MKIVTILHDFMVGIINMDAVGIALQRTGSIRNDAQCDENRDTFIDQGYLKSIICKLHIVDLGSIRKAVCTQTGYPCIILFLSETNAKM